MSGERYTKDHEWVRFSGDEATCGISDFAQKALGDVVFVELPKIGQRVKQGEQVAVVESVKAAGEVYAPVDGTVVEVNGALADNPALVNSAPLDVGWFFKLENADADQTATLMDAAAYADFIKTA